MRALLWTALLSLTLFARPAWSQEPAPQPDPSPAQPPASQPVAEEPARTPDLHKIYIPYEKLDEVLGTDKERVMVPYKEFLDLWNFKYGTKDPKAKPPVPFTVESAVYDGRVREGVAHFEATIGIEVFEEKWQRIPLPFKSIAFEEVLVDGEPGVLVPTKQGYDLVLRGKGRRTLKVKFVAGVAKGKEFAATGFGLPAVPLQRLTFRVPGKGTEIKIEPARAHSTSDEGDETVLMAFLGPQGTVKLTWRFQPEETEREPPLLFATDTIDVRVEERVLRGRVQFDIDVLRSPASSFQVRLPKKLQVLEVTGANIRSWGFRDTERRDLRVVLHKEVTGRYTLGVGFEGPVEVPGTLSAPVFRVDGAARENGYLRVYAAEGVGVRPVSTENVFQVDLNSLPKTIRGGTRAVGFRFPSLPWALGLKTERIAPRVTLTTRARLEVERRTIKLDTQLQFNVERAGVFGIDIEVPKGIILTDVGDPKLVDSRRESVKDGRRILSLDLRGRRIGRFTLPIRGMASLDLAQGELSVPLLKVLGVDREEGTLGVFMDPGIKAVADAKSMIPLEPKKFRAEDRFPSKLPLQFAWRWRGGDAAVDFKVEARKPKVTCDVRYRLQAEEGRVRLRADLAYQVQFTGVETFRFRVPRTMVGKMEIDGRNIREKSSKDDPVEEGKDPTTTWTVALQSPALGEVVLQIEYDEVFPRPLQVNETRPVAIPALLPLDVESANTYAAVRKAPVIKVDSSTEDYEQIDASELPASLRGDDVFLALRRFDEPEPFRIDLEKHEYLPVADLVVRHGHLETVLAEDKRATTTAYFEIFNNDRQFLAVKLPEGSDVLELRVAGKPETPRRGDGGILLVRLLTGLAKDATFQVAIAYTHPVETRGALYETTRIAGPVLPKFEETPAPVQTLLTWAVYYPEAWRVSGFDGNVEPAGRDAEGGSWLQRAIGGLGRLIRPADAEAGRKVGRPVQEDGWEEIVPMYKERESVRSVFTNGSGDAELEITHSTALVQTILVLLAIAAGIAAVVFLARAFKPLHAGGLLCLAALVLLSFAGRGWVPIWNGFFFAAAAATLYVVLAERRGAKKA